MEKNLLKEAIADAKVIKETAMANAKLALEEAFAPHLKNLLSAKLQEMELDEEEVLELEEDYSSYDDEETNEEIDLVFEEADDEDMVTNLNVKDFKELLSSLIAKELGNEEGEEEGGEEGEEKGEEEEGGEEGEEENFEELDEEIDIESLINEIENESNLEEDVDLNELLNSILSEMEDEESKKSNEEMDKEIEEALETINQLRTELNEVNVLNAKLLYLNKVFRNHTLSESQKVQIVNSFDKANTAKEAKLVYETLQESLKIKTKNPIKESLGSASKVVKTTKSKTPILESNDITQRFKILANIKN